MPDIAYHVDKIQRGFDYVVDIFGADHHATWPDVLAGCAPWATIPPASR